MATFVYRAVRFDGSTSSGRIEAASRNDAIINLRRAGTTPLEISLAVPDKAGRPRRANARTRMAAGAAVGALAVLLEAGLPLDRALALGVENADDKVVAACLADIAREVREGTPLSRAMADKPDLFSPTAIAMAEAGEANGQLGAALTRLAHMIDQEAELRRLVASSAIYPIALLVIATGVVLLMLLFVVPQFESLFASAADRLPASTKFVMAASQTLRRQGLILLVLLGIAGFGVAAALRQPAVRFARDRLVLAMPLLGELVRRIETGRFARTLGALVEGEVALPAALALAQRTIANQVLGRAIGRVADGVREGGGLTAPLVASGVLPRLAIGFLRMGEETSRLGEMLTRLADVLDRDVRTRIERLIGILTPVITVVLGATVAAIIASIMSAILGFNDLALTS